MKLTVYFDGQFWVGVVEHEEDGALKVCRYLFGKEPKNEEVLFFVHHTMMHLVEQVTASIDVCHKKEHRLNPKRMARMVIKEMKQKGIQTKAQEAIKLDIEKRKVSQKVVSRTRKEELREKKRQLKIAKHKQKHRGR